MNDFLSQIQCDESAASNADWAEYQRHLDGELQAEAFDAANAELNAVADAEVAEQADAELEAEFPTVDRCSCGEVLVAVDDDGDFCPICDQEVDDEHDGQPDEYTEWQDYMGGDDWDQGQYDSMDYDCMNDF